ncbi:hypothetical protein HMSSN139_27610 [Paenibacillus sp. HMSSN-139]|nr:hypothetical protein HMSSN139_27610 [Paenibacillus sp. HMSSN-139]
MDNLSVTSLVWLFLVTFVIHDMEEIIWVGPWGEAESAEGHGDGPSAHETFVDADA